MFLSVPFVLKIITEISKTLESKKRSSFYLTHQIK